MRRIGLGIGIASLLALPFALDFRIAPAAQPLSDAWRFTPISPRGPTLLGISFRPPQLEALGLAPEPALRRLLAFPFQIIRLGAYWNRIERAPGQFDTSELDWQVEAAERAGKQIILGVGALKTFSYPEFFVPAHRLVSPIPEHTLVSPTSHPVLLTAATTFIAQIIDRYKSHPGIIAWQVEHEAVDPLGLEHSWRLATAFVAQEVETVRQTDSSRPIMLNGFLPTSLLGRLAQWWQTRDQGDSLAVARELADIVGVDYYPRYAVAAFGGKALYLDGTGSPWQRQLPRQLLARAHDRQQKLMVSEGQAEPWETVTVSPNPAEQNMYSCRPEQIIHNYNAWLRWSSRDAALYAYLFWGAEYWLLRERSGDLSYLQAFARILENA
ncbi:MAG TPA: beta-galactosidase [Chloroflexota bacterium]|nr:beta-galactosidase [Chloroflexota bacterium]